MNTTLREPTRQSYTHLIADVAGGARDLVAAHVEQMGSEVKAEADRATSVLGYFSAAGTLIAIGFVCGIVAITQLLQERYGFSGAAAWALTGLFTVLSGLGMLAIARWQLTTVHWIPKKSFHSLQESLQWATRK